MSDIKLPKVLEFFQTKTLTKGRIQTTLNLFMMDAEVFDSICLAYIRGEASVVECRVGTTIKAPKDKYDKVIAKQEAYKKIKKQRLSIDKVISTIEHSTIWLENKMYIKRSASGMITIHAY
jgi:hypothetical protein